MVGGRPLGFRFSLRWNDGRDRPQHDHMETGPCTAFTTATGIAQLRSRHLPYLANHHSSPRSRTSGGRGSPNVLVSQSPAQGPRPTARSRLVPGDLLLQQRQSDHAIHPHRRHTTAYATNSVYCAYLAPVPHRAPHLCLRGVGSPPWTSGRGTPSSLLSQSRTPGTPLTRRIGLSQRLKDLDK